MNDDSKLLVKDLEKRINTFVRELALSADYSSISTTHSPSLQSPTSDHENSWHHDSLNVMISPTFVRSLYYGDYTSLIKSMMNQFIQNRSNYEDLDHSSMRKYMKKFELRAPGWFKMMEREKLGKSTSGKGSKSGRTQSGDQMERIVVNKLTIRHVKEILDSKSYFKDEDHDHRILTSNTLSYQNKVCATYGFTPTKEVPIPFFIMGKPDISVPCNHKNADGTRTTRFPIEIKARSMLTEVKDYEEKAHKIQLMMYMFMMKSKFGMLYTTDMNEKEPDVQKLVLWDNSFWEKEVLSRIHLIVRIYDTFINNGVNRIKLINTILSKSKLYKDNMKMVNGHVSNVLKSNVHAFEPLWIPRHVYKSSEVELMSEPVSDDAENYNTYENGGSVPSMDHSVSSSDDPMTESAEMSTVETNTLEPSILEDSFLEDSVDLEAPVDGEDEEKSLEPLTSVASKVIVPPKKTTSLETVEKATKRKMDEEQEVSVKQFHYEFNMDDNYEKICNVLKRSTTSIDDHYMSFSDLYISDIRDTKPIRFEKLSHLKKTSVFESFTDFQSFDNLLQESKILYHNSNTSKSQKIKNVIMEHRGKLVVHRETMNVLLSSSHYDKESWIHIIELMKKLDAETSKKAKMELVVLLNLMNISVYNCYQRFAFEPHFNTILEKDRICYFGEWSDQSVSFRSTNDIHSILSSGNILTLRAHMVRGKDNRNSVMERIVSTYRSPSFPLVERRVNKKNMFMGNVFAHDQTVLDSGHSALSNIRTSSMLKPNAFMPKLHIQGKKDETFRSQSLIYRIKNGDDFCYSISYRVYDNDSFDDIVDRTTLKRMNTQLFTHSDKQYSLSTFSVALHKLNMQSIVKNNVPLFPICDASDFFIDIHDHLWIYVNDKLQDVGSIYELDMDSCYVQSKYRTSDWRSLISEDGKDEGKDNGMDRAKRSRMET